MFTDKIYVGWLKVNEYFLPNDLDNVNMNLINILWHGYKQNFIYGSKL